MVGKAGAHRRWYDRRPTSLLILCGAILSAVILGATVLIISETRAKEVADAERELSTLNLSLAEQTARSVQGVDLVLQSIADQIKADGIDSASGFVQAEAGVEVFKALQTRVADVPQLDAVTLISTAGDLINFSRYFPIPTVNVADRDYFKALSTQRSDRPFISAPVENRGTGTYTLYVARRLDDHLGNFMGLVLGAVNLSYFEDLYKSLDLGPRSGVSLWRRDGVLLARYPSIGGVGKVFQLKSFTETLLNADAGVYHVDNSIDGYRRIVATRALRDYPMVVNVTRTLDDVLSDWRRVSFIIGAAGIFCACAAALVAAMLVRQFATFESLTLAQREKAEAILGRERAESELHQSQKLEAVGKLTTGVAHDFNNLLTAIVGNLSFLKRDAKDDAARKRVDAIETAVDRAATLTGQLLAFSRKQQLFPEEVDLNGLVSGLGDMLRSLLGGTILLEFALEPDLWPVHVDRVQIELVLLNLAINARDAMPGGGVLAITTSNVGTGPADLPAGDYVCVQVTDIGSGMTQDVAARAFDPFFTTKPVGKGTGLGLSQAYGTVRQSGGSIHIDTVLEEGTTVAFHLPRSGKSRAVVPLRPVSRLARVSTGSRALRVLVVDDDGPVRKAISEMVEETGYPVSEAESGARALEMIAADPTINLVVMDFAMPSMNGAEAARRARTLKPDLPIVFVTGYADVESLAGERSVIRKPFRQEDLAAKLRAAIGATG